MAIGLKYIDEADKCYGITGMAISIVATNGEELLAAVDLDGEEAISFTPDYYFAGNQNLSAKISWRHILEHFQFTSAMMIANVMCRHYVHHRKNVDRQLMDLMHRLMEEEGSESCSLESDEIDAIFTRLSNYFHNLFNNAGVQQLAHSFADTLTRSRQLSCAEILEQLYPLQRMF